jgi:hypothetical protein
VDGNCTQIGAITAEAATALEAVTGQKIIIRGGKAVIIEPDVA